MNSPRFSNAAAACLVPSHSWRGVIGTVASIVCLWAFAAGGAPPANDNRANATALTLVGTYTRVPGNSNVDATKEPGEPNHGGNAGGKSIWFRWTGTAAAVMRFDTVGTAFDTVMAVYTTNVLGSLVLVTENDEQNVPYFRYTGGYHQSRASISAAVGTTYFIAVDGFNSGAGAPSGPVVLNMNLLSGLPVNDAFTAPIVITGTATEGGYSGRTHNATEQGGEPDHGGGSPPNPGGRSVWYRWTAPISGQAVIDTMASSHGFPNAPDTLLGVYTGNTLAQLTSVAQNDDFNAFIYTSRVTFTAVQNTVYQIVVDGYNGGSGASVGSVALHFSVANTPPANDNFANAQPLNGSKGTVNGMTHAATVEAGEPTKDGSPGGRSVWFNWTPAVSGQVTFDTMGIHYDSLLAAFTGDDIAGLTPVAENDDILYFDGIGSVTSVSRISFMASGGTTYHIVVDGYSEPGFPADYGNFSLNWEQAVTAPSNDLFAAATILQGNRGSVTNSSTNAVFEAGEPIHSVVFTPTTIFIGGMCGKSLWYKWTVAHSRPVTIDTSGSSYDTFLAVYTGTDLASLVVVTNNDNVGAPDLTSRVEFDGVEGTTYYIAVDGQNDATGRGAANGTLMLHYNQPGGPPPNDNFADAIVLTGLSGSIGGFSFDASTELDEPDRGLIPANDSSWYRWTAPVSGWFTFDTLGSPLDTVLAIYTGSAFPLAEVDSNDNIDAGAQIYQSRVTFLATGGVTYQIAVDGRSGVQAGMAQDDFVLNWAPTARLSMEIVGGNLLLTLTVADGDMYIIQESTNLTSWSPVETVSAGGGPATRDLGAIAGIPHKFYRAIQAP